MGRPKRTVSKARLLVVYSAVLLLSVLKLWGYEEPGKRTEPAPREPIYDASMDVAAVIQRATEEGNDRRLLLMLGGNWCGWCYELHDLLHGDPAIRTLLDERCHLVLVDIRANPWILDRYEASPRGYPFLIVLDAGGTLLTTQNTDVFVDDYTAHNSMRVYEFLSEWAGGS